MSEIDTDQFRMRLEEERVRLTSTVEFLAREHPGSLEDELGEPIGAARLSAIPWASLCIDDQRRRDG